MRKRYIISLLLLPLAPLLTWLLWPLDDAQKWDISENKELSGGKLDYLGVKDTGTDTFETRPNVVIILADDLSKYDISLYGGTHVATPFIDAIGRNGVTFSEAYVTAPICAPSRASLLTGRYNQRFGFEIQPQKRYPRNRLEYYVFKYIIDTDNWRVAPGTSYPAKKNIRNQGLPSSEITLAEVLKKQGYTTGITGKWHLGDTPGHRPYELGFDFHYGFYEAFTWYADSTDPEIVNAAVDEFSDKHIWKQRRNGTCAIRRNDTIIEETEYLTFAIAREANRFISENKSHPFFLYVPFNAPHTPFQAPRNYYEMYAGEKDHHKRVYYAMVKALDDAVGSIMKTLEKHHLDSNTLVYFASDNGAATYTGTATNFPLKGGKLSNFEGGINIPYMMQWKGHIPTAQVYREPVTLLDVFVTSAAVTNAPLPPDREIDGVNLMPFITGTVTEEIPHPVLFWRCDYNKAVRKGDWKLIVDTRHKLIHLYNLKVDKYEKTNQAADYEKMVDELKQAIDNWEKTMMQPLWPRIMDYRMEIDGEIYYFAV